MSMTCTARSRRRAARSSIRRKRSTLPGYTVVVNAHPAVADVLNGTEKTALQDAESRFMRKIVVTPRKEYHLEQFDLVGK